MRHVILIAVLTPLAHAALAQTNTGNMAAPTSPSMTSPGTGTAAGPPDPDNCGTPDEPAKCPPMPRHPLNYYPANRKS